LSADFVGRARGRGIAVAHAFESYRPAACRRAYRAGRGHPDSRPARLFRALSRHPAGNGLQRPPDRPDRRGRRLRGARRRAGRLQLDCAPRRHLAFRNLRYGRPTHPDELPRHRCVNYFSARTGKMYDWDFTRDTERVQVPLPGVIAVNDSNAYVAAGLAGLGIMQMTTFMLEPLLANGRLEVILPDWISDPLPVHVVYPQNRHLSAKVRVFVEWVAELFANHPGMQLPKGQPARAIPFEVAL